MMIVWPVGTLPNAQTAMSQTTGENGMDYGRQVQGTSTIPSTGFLRSTYISIGIGIRISCILGFLILSGG